MSPPEVTSCEAGSILLLDIAFCTEVDSEEGRGIGLMLSAYRMIHKCNTVVLTGIIESDRDWRCYTRITKV
jgi:hypothetical protein